MHVTGGLVYGVDIDSVIIDLTEGMCRALNGRLCTNYDTEIFTTWGWEENPILAPHAFWFWETVFGTREFQLECEPVRGALQAVRALYLKGKVVLITARKQQHQGVTLEWLMRHNIPYDSLYFSHDKANLALDLGVDLFFDDAPHQARSLSSAGIPVVLFDYAYNRGLPPHSLITRVTSWEQAMREAENVS